MWEIAGMLPGMHENSWKAVALVLSGIVVGCGANAMRGAQAEAPTQPVGGLPPGATAWQQYCQEADDWREMDRTVRAAGAAGFEMVTTIVKHQGTDDLLVCFKRPGV